MAAGRKLRPIWDDGSKFRSKVVEFVNEGVLEELTHYPLKQTIGAFSPLYNFAICLNTMLYICQSTAVHIGPIL